MHFSRGFLLLAAAGLCLPAAGRVRAQLVDTSPFMAPGGAAGPGGAVDANALELRGIMSTPEGTRYCIYDPVKKAGSWAAVNERGNSFMIKAADLAHQAVTVQSEGRTVRLTLRAFKMAALGGQGALGAQPALTAAPGAPGAARPSPSDEAARLAAVADAVRARRQMREQASQGGDQAAPAARRAQP